MKNNPIMLSRLLAAATLKALLVAGIIPAAGAASDTSGSQTPTNLRCEYLKNPQGVDVSKPRFFWEDRSEARGFRQSAWQLELKRDTQAIWDSGKVASGETVQIEYNGPALAPCTLYSWRVRVWDQNNKASDWSAPARFSTGLRDWKAQWIGRRPEAEWRARYQASRDAEAKDPSGRWSNPDNQPRDPLEWITAHPKPIHDPAPLLRKGFSLDKPVKTALLYVTGLGHYQLFLNGERADNGALAPGFTDYNKRVLYNTYDLTSLLKRGGNCLGLMLGRGWYNELCGAEPWGFSKASWVAQPKAIAELHILFEDGSRQLIASDETWKAADGPMVFDDMRFGEVYDATREIPGWCCATFDDAGWANAALVPAPKGKLTAEVMEPVRGTAEFKPTAVTPLPAGKEAWLFAFPQNLACQARLSFNGAGMRGKTLKFTFNTFLDKAGRLATASGATSSYYICKGEPREVIQLPQFGYVGGRYVTIEGLASATAAEELRLVEVRSAVEDAGTFECSDPLLNQLQSNIRYTQSSALHSFPQDCWTREKLGWTGDAHVTCEEALFNFGMGPHYTKYLQDHADNQSAGGGISAYVPDHREGNESVTWSGTCIVIPWQLYTYYGDKRILAEMFEVGKKYLAAAQQEGKRPLIFFGGPADWCPPWAKTPGQLEYGHAELGVPRGTFPGAPEGHLFYGTAHYFRLCTLMARIAGILGKTEDAVWFVTRAAAVKAALNAEFFDAATATYRGDKPTEYRQAANAHALWLGLAPAEQRQEVLANLVGDIVAKHGGHLNTGVLGTQALFEGLPEAGRADIAFEMAMQKDYPGYFWPMLEYGLTTLPEHWEGFGTHEHPMFGSVGAFLYKRLAGIQPDPAAPGFKHFFIRPAFNVPLTFVKATYHSVRGQIRSEWRKEGGTLTLEVEVPCNTEANVFVSDTDVRHVGSGRHIFRTAWLEKQSARTDRVVHPGEGEVRSEQRVWRVIEKPGERLLVRPAVELQYVTPSLVVAPDFAGAQSVFYLCNSRTRTNELTVTAEAPAGWRVSFQPTMPVRLAPGQRAQVFAMLQPPADIADGATNAIGIIVSEGARRVERVAIPWEAAATVADSWTKDFNWKSEGSLKMEPQDGRLRLTSPGNASAMLSGWRVVDFSKPLQVRVNVSAITPGAKWALYFEDNRGFYRALFGDNPQTGLSERPASELSWSGPHRFRMKFYCIDGGMTLDSVTIKP
ncbi:MAG: family 78 glycoside hydrolase catalytic domain [bacterium]